MKPLSTLVPFGCIIGSLFLFDAVELAAQELNEPDSLNNTEREIRALPETDISLLGKSRAALVEAIQNRDTARAKRILAFMDRRFNRSRIVALYPGEELLVAYWVREYDRVFSYVATGGSEEDQRGDKLYPLNDLMFDKLKTESEGARGQLMAEVQTSGLPEYKTDFLALLFDDVMGPADESEASRAEFQSHMNAKADEYLAKHKDSEYNGFVHDNIRYVIAPSPWGWGYEIGGGYLALPSSLNEHMKDFGLLTLALEGAYQQWYACMRLDVGGANHLKKGFTYNGEWKDGLQVMHVGVLLAGGQMISLGNNFTLTPTFGIGVLDFSPPEEVKNQDGNDVSLTIPALAFGANFDIPTGSGQGSPFIRLNAGYRVAMTNNALARGGYTFITLSVNFFNRLMVRD